MSFGVHKVLGRTPLHAPATKLANRMGWEACFSAKTPLRIPEGWKWIELLRRGDRVLSRDENDPSGPLVAKMVEEVFVREGLIWHLYVGGQVIRTTAEHPFFVEGRGWVACHELKVGDRLLDEDGGWVPVEDLLDTGEWETVYNLRVESFHTYFVGSPEWGFSVWAHNADAPLAEFNYGRINILEFYRTKILGADAVPQVRSSVMDPTKKVTIMLPGADINLRGVTVPGANQSIATYAIVEMGDTPKVKYIGHASLSTTKDFDATVERAIKNRFYGTKHDWFNPEKHVVVPLKTYASERAARGGERFFFDTMKQLGHDLVHVDEPLGLKGSTASDTKRVAGKVAKLEAFFASMGEEEVGVTVKRMKGC